MATSESEGGRPSRIRINRVYTRSGDAGETALVGGHRVQKDAARIEAYGTVDELNATVGLCRLHTAADKRLAALDVILRRVQNELFNLGSMLATRPEDLHPRQPVITAAHSAQLEQEIDHFNQHLPELRSFVLPGGGAAAAHLHLARTVCRRAERLAVTLVRDEPVSPEAVRYLNRLSDAFFVFSRWAVHAIGEPEVLWEAVLP